MSQAEQFRQFAREAMGWAMRARQEEHRMGFIMLAQTWTEAALRAETAQRCRERQSEAA